MATSPTANNRKTRLGALLPERTFFMMCDFQEKFRDVIYRFNDVLRVARRLTEAAKILEVPLVVTEQYPKGLGNTVSEIQLAHAVGVFEKTKFSMMIPAVETALSELSDRDVNAVVLFGIETHVCIEQTAIDLVARNFIVHIAADACSSRSQQDRLLALDRLRQIGCFITTAETVIFKLLGDKTHPKFNDVKGLLKDVSPETLLVPVYKL